LLQGASFAFTYAVASFPLAYLADRFSSKWVIICSVVAWSAMILVFGLATSFSFLVLARVGLALGEAGLSPAATRLFRQSYKPERQGFGVTLLTTSVYVGGCISMLIGGPTLAVLEQNMAHLPFGLAPWRLMFIACGLIGISAVLVLLLIPDL